MNKDKERDALVVEIALRLETLVGEVQTELTRLRDAVSSLRSKWGSRDTERERETVNVLRRADLIQSEVVDRAAQLQAELLNLRQLIEKDRGERGE